MTRVLGLPPALDLDRCLVMGVLNVTPDSFSDGGRWLDREAAVAHGLALMREGADLVDVGGESTRPGAQRVSAEEELARVLPVVAALARARVPVSIDTMRAATAAAALEAGALLVNDVSGGLADADLPRVARDAGAAYVVMHWRSHSDIGHSDAMARQAHYLDVVAEVAAELCARVDTVLAAGLLLEQVILDPGLGFAKDAPHNWAVLAGLDRLLALGRPLLVGASRKRFLGSLLAAPGGAPVAVEDRDDATSAVSALAAAAGVWAVRVHRPGPSRAAVEVAEAVRGAGARAAGSTP